MTRARRTEAALFAMLPPLVGPGVVPEESRLVRILGCPDTRQFEVLELGGMIMVREIATVSNPAPGTRVATLPLAQVLNAMAADVLKANDGSCQ